MIISQLSDTYPRPMTLRISGGYTLCCSHSNNMGNNKYEVESEPELVTIAYSKIVAIWEMME